MSKGTYSAVDFQVWFSDESRIEKYQGDELVVGVDVGKIAFYAAVQTLESDESEVLYFERDQIPEFIESLADLDFETVSVVLEPTGTYGDPLIEHSREAGFEVIQINGDRVSNARKVFDGVDSLHDGKSAYLLAYLYLCGVGTPWKETTESTRELRALADLDKMVNVTEQKYLGQLEALLARYWPELTNFLDLQGATLLELLAKYGGPAWVAEDSTNAAKLMRKVGGHFLKEEKIEGVLESTCTTIGQAMTPTERQKVKYIAGMFRESQRRSSNLTKELKKVGEEHEDTKNLAGFTGARTALILVGMLGPLTDYDSPEQLEKAQGLNLCERSSGQTAEAKRKTSQGLRISKRGPGYVRKMMYWLAMRMINHCSPHYCPYGRAWYMERLRRNGGDGLRASVALMRKLIRAVWWIARGESYDGTKLFNVARLEKAGHL